MNQVTVLGKLYNEIESDDCATDFTLTEHDCDVAPTCSWQCREDGNDVYFVEVKE